MKRIFLLILLAPSLPAAEPVPLAGTKPLTTQGDLSSLMLQGMEKFLLSQTRHPSSRLPRPS